MVEKISEAEHMRNVLTAARAMTKMQLRDAQEVIAEAASNHQAQASGELLAGVVQAMAINAAAIMISTRLPESDEDHATALP